MSTALPTLLTLLLLAAPSPEAGAPHGALYQEALYRQKILGDLPGALAMFERASATDAPVEVRARATLQCAICLRDLDRVEDATRVLDALRADVELMAVPEVRERADRIRDDIDKEVLEEAAEEYRQRILEFERRGEAANEDLERKMAEVKEKLAALERDRPKPVEDAGGALDHEALLEKIRAGRERAVELQLLAREREVEGDFVGARRMLLEARKADPGNRSVAEALRAVSRRLGRGDESSDDAVRMMRLEREVRREVVPREVDRLYENGRRLLADEDVDGAAELFAAILQLHLRHPELATLLVDRVVPARRFLEQCVEKGARPSFLRSDPRAAGRRDWLEDLYRLEESTAGADLPRRIHSIAHLDRREAEEAEEASAPGPATGIIRAVRPGRFPGEALVELIRHRVSPATWDGRGRFVRLVGGSRVVVRNEDGAQTAVEKLMNSFVGPAEGSGRVAFEAVVLGVRDLEEITGALATRFFDREGVTYAILGPAALREWDRRTRRPRRRGTAAIASPAGRPVRLDGTRRVNAKIGHEEAIVRGRAVSLPVVRTVLAGLRLDALMLPGAEGSSAVGIEGEVSVLVGPFELRSEGAETMRVFGVLGQPFTLAADVPEGGALLLTGLANPFLPVRDDDVLSVLVRPGAAAAAAAESPAEGEGVRIEDLSAGQDYPGPRFAIPGIARGPERPLSAVEMVLDELASKGLEVEERDGHLVASGARRSEAREALWSVLGRRRELIEIRVRAIPLAGEKPPVGSVVAVEPEGVARAWRVAGPVFPEDAPSRLTVGRVVASSLQRMHLREVKEIAHVSEYEPDPGSPVPSPLPVLGMVEKGIVVDVRAFPEGRDVVLSVLVKTAEVESVTDVEEGIDLGTGPLPVTVPRQRIHRIRALVRLSPGQRLVVADLPDPFGDGKLAVEIHARRLPR